MWRLIKFTILTVFLAAAGLIAYFGWLLLTPVSADNVEGRIARVCSVATSLAAMKVAHLDRDIPPVKSGQCRCAAREAVQAYGAGEAARIGEFLRSNLVRAVQFQRPSLSREDERALEGLTRLTGAHLRKCPAG